MPTTARPRSANDRASGSPTRPRPTTDDLGVALRGGHATQEVSGGEARFAPAAVREPRVRSAAIAQARVHVLAREAGDEAGVVAGVAPPQAPRLCARGGRSTRGPSAASSGGACGTRPAWKSKAAPTPTSSGADRRGRISSIQLSCLGWPVPTHTTSAPEESIVGDRLLLLGGGERAERRRVAARDHEAGEALAQTRFQQLERLGRAASVQVHGRAASVPPARRIRAIRSGP